MAIEELLRRYEAGGGRLAATRAKGLPVPPALHTAVLTCMDARIDVFALFGLSLGEVHMLRNAGGVVTDDVIRSLTISQRKLATREIVIVQHTGCGMSTFTDDEFSEEIARETGMRPAWRTHAFRDPAVSVRRDMALLRRDPFLVDGTRIRGFVLDLADCHLHEIHADDRSSAAPPTSGGTRAPAPRRRTGRSRRP